MLQSNKDFLMLDFQATHLNLMGHHIGDLYRSLSDHGESFTLIQVEKLGPITFIATKAAPIKVIFILKN